MALLTSQLDLYYNSDSGDASYRETAICPRLWWAFLEFELGERVRFHHDPLFVGYSHLFGRFARFFTSTCLSLNPWPIERQECC